MPRVLKVLPEEIKRHKAKWEVKVLEMGENKGNVENHRDYLTKDNLHMYPLKRACSMRLFVFITTPTLRDTQGRQKPPNLYYDIIGGPQSIGMSKHMLGDALPAKEQRPFLVNREDF